MHFKEVTWERRKIVIFGYADRVYRPLYLPIVAMHVAIYSLIDLNQTNMKNTLIVLSLALTALMALAFTNHVEQDSNSATYATIFYTNQTRQLQNTIVIYYGGQRIEKVTVKANEEWEDRIIDTLNDLSKKGFELVSTDIQRVAGENFSEFRYTLKKSSKS